MRPAASRPPPVSASREAAAQSAFSEAQLLPGDVDWFGLYAARAGTVGLGEVGGVGEGGGVGLGVGGVGWGRVR